MSPVGQDGTPAVMMKSDVAVVKTLARALRYQRLLDEGRHASISEMAEGEKLEPGYLGTLLRLTLLAPDLVELIVDGRAGDSVALPTLLEPLPSAWAQQRGHLMSGEPTRRAELEVVSRHLIAA